ncbi:MAG: TonB-dependent receptor [Lewinellaceae bacterium]|nr:TonB-dependent receptor [Lewinellaceae bacterium]
MRASWGQSGMQPISDGLSRETLGPNVHYYSDGNYLPGLTVVNNANPNLRAERNTALNIGLDVQLFHGNLSASLNWFQHTNDRLLIPTQVPQPPNQAGNTWLNTGELRNTGMDAQISWNHIVNTSQLDWSADLVLWGTNTQLVNIGWSTPDFTAYIGSPGFCCAGYILVENDAPLGQLYGLVQAGVNPDGTIQYKDLNKDQTVDIYNAVSPDKQVLGQGTPKLEMGINQTLRYGRWDLNVFLRGAFGHSLAHDNRVHYENLEPDFGLYNHIKTSYFNSRIRDYTQISDVFVEKANFLRLDNATLGYRFAFKETARIQMLRLYVGGQNMLVFSKYTGMDPEVRWQDNGTFDNGGRPYSASPNLLAPGVDRRGTYYLSKTYFLGVQAGF